MQAQAPTMVALIENATFLVTCKDRPSHVDLAAWTKLQAHAASFLSTCFTEAHTVLTDHQSQPPTEST